MRVSADPLFLGATRPPMRQTRVQASRSLEPGVGPGTRGVAMQEEYVDGRNQPSESRRINAFRHPLVRTAGVARDSCAIRRQPFRIECLRRLMFRANATVRHPKISSPNPISASTANRCGRRDVAPMIMGTPRKLAVVQSGSSRQKRGQFLGLTAVGNSCFGPESPRAGSCVMASL